MNFLFFWTKPFYWYCFFKRFAYVIWKPKDNCIFVTPLQVLNTQSYFCNTIMFKSLTISRFFSLWLQYMIMTWYKFLNLKIKFRHKISWIKSYYGIYSYLLIDTNKSHYVIYPMNSYYMKSKKKYFTYNSLVLKGSNLFYLKKLAMNLINNFPWDKYTSRGFRLGRQSLFRSPGKMSQYSMLKKKIF